MANGVRGSNEASMNRDIKGAKEEGSNTRKSESSQDRGWKSCQLIQVWMANGVRGSNEANMNTKGAKEEGSNTRKSESSQDRGKSSM
ncbi:uncharacterized protein LOC110879028 isoform X2 [Helianthus annuus]|uniref:uncharacterized protein LOC110879028 isoform X2 n=1 Tax=Helianthus annuus TaxID=4232 RepID=UPI001652C028|nr:uncharacterized protein LOC110879028 isoform X2 [Helianthus annuus]XP_035833616.1 uncharacterized protein LOC110879028 isoform X2 [Helianthus annuus]